MTLESGTIKVACVGDVMLGDSFHALGSGTGTHLDRYGAGYLPTPVQTFLRSHDVVFGNLECVLGDEDRRDWSLRSVSMRGRPAYASHLAEWGFNVLNVANNHILDHGLAAARSTVAHLRAAGIAITGSGGDGAFGPGVEVAEVPFGLSVAAFVGFCTLDERTAFAGAASADQLVAAVGELVGAGRTVVASVHGGREFMDRPGPGQRALTDRLIAAGATAVIGHHSHVVQGVDHTDGRLAAHSLGNFIFDGFAADTKWSIILSFELTAGQVQSWTYRIIASDPEHRPHLVEGGRRHQLQEEFGRRCALVERDRAPLESADAYDNDVAERQRANSADLRIHLRSAIPRFRPVFWPQILWHPLDRRLKAVARRALVGRRSTG